MQYRWILVLYHAGEEMDRIPSSEWYNSLEECKQAAKQFEFDYCCGYDFKFERQPDDDEEDTA